MIELTEEQQAIKNHILDELGLLNFKPGSFKGQKVRGYAAHSFAKSLAKHTMSGDPIAYCLYANDIFLFIIEIAEHGDIGIDDVESTKSAIEYVIDAMFEIFPCKNDEWRKEILAQKLNMLIATHPLFRPELDMVD